jgi:hypothetical protein
VNLTDSTVRGNTSGAEGGGIFNWVMGSTVKLIASTITDNTAGTEAGGIWNYAGPQFAPGVVILDASSSVTGNMPDDCVGTTAC